MWEAWAPDIRDQYFLNTMQRWWRRGWQYVLDSGVLQNTLVVPFPPAFSVGPEWHKLLLELLPPLAAKQHAPTSMVRRGHPRQLLLTRSKTWATAVSFALLSFCHTRCIASTWQWCWCGRWQRQDAARFPSDKSAWDVLIGCIRGLHVFTPLHRVWNTPSGQPHPAAFQDVILHSVSQFFFLRQERLQRGKEANKKKIQKHILRWNGQILTNIEGKIKLFIKSLNKRLHKRIKAKPIIQTMITSFIYKFLWKILSGQTAILEVKSWFCSSVLPVFEVKCETSSKCHPVVVPPQDIVLKLIELLGYIKHCSAGEVI